jgi:predicted extracellular nuclease
VAAEPWILISEVMAGVQGNNNFEFIELYNSGDAMVDLRGWSLWYRLASSEEDLPVYSWRERALIPPHGHYLLGRTGQDLGIVVNAEFDQALNTSGGGLELRRPDGRRADALGWGKAPEAMTEGTPAPALENGSSLERLPGGVNGSMDDADDNAGDFQINTLPAPQNTGSPVTPPAEKRFAVRLTAPEAVEPGSSFEYSLAVTNHMETAARGLVVQLTIPPELTITSLPADVTLEEGVATWRLEAIEAGGSLSTQITVTAPWAHLTTLATNYYVEVKDPPGLAMGEPVRTRVEGGVIPIGTARTLLGAELTVEGFATMYTGGYYAGSGNVKFYLEDETGGLQVWVPGGQGVVDVPVGARVRVRGTMDLYRGSLELIVGALEDVEVLPGDGEPWQPTPVSLRQAANDMEALPGRLIQVEGTATRLEEFAYSHEIDLVDDQGQLLTLYIDKLTRISAETIEAGRQYRAAGILEVRDGYLRLYPRLQSDLAEIFPAVLMIDAEAPNAVQPGEVFTTTFRVFNHTSDTMTDLQIRAPVPAGGARLEAVLDGGSVREGELIWSVSQLAGGGASVGVRYQVRAPGTVGQMVSEGYSATAAEWPEPAEGPPLRVFVGQGVPIWALQGPGSRSPYVLDRVTTSGVVTGVFPELGGFWIQETVTDDDALTSAGLFVATGDEEVAVGPGDLVEVSGQVREISQQTQLQVGAPGDVRLLGEGYQLPEPVSLDPPAEETEAAWYYEALEGMLVQVPGPALAVSPTSKYGEYALVLPYHDVERLWRGDETGMVIMVDDGSSAIHHDRSALPYVVGTGDQVSGLLGPLAFTFGRYKIEPITVPQVAEVRRELPTLTATAADEFSIMTWNVENLFDILDPHPSSPPRPRKADYELALTKVANTILAAGAPTVIGLQEVENIGILEDLAAHELLAAYRYQPVLVEGTDSRGIDVGYLVRGDRATIVEVQQYAAPEGLTSRPPLLVQIGVETDLGTATLYVINNHFTSLAGGQAATLPRRTAQAAWNVAIVEEVQAEEPEAYVAVIGDLNSFYQSPPIDILRQAGLRHVFERLAEDERYTYIFEGVSQTLDHILVTPSLMTLLRRVEVLRTNTDYPPPEPADDSPRRKSDHDPVVATFSLAP